jgi:hypothetical protein
MTSVFKYALLRAARQRMTVEEAEVAAKLAGMADDGSESAAEALERIVTEVLFDRNRPSRQ